MTTENPKWECPDCGSTDWREEVGTHEFGYGADPNTVTLSATYPVMICNACGFGMTDWRGEDARHAAVQAHLGIKEIPITCESTTLVATDSDRKINFSVYERLGTDLIRPPVGSPHWPLKTMEDVDALAIDANLITDPNGLVEGEDLLVQDLIGWGVGRVSRTEAGELICVSPNGNMLYMIAYDASHPDLTPPCWVCTGSANMKGLRKLNLTR